MSGVKSNRQLWGKEFPVGGEWDAGATPPLMPTIPAGRWTVRREPEHFTVVFHSFGDGQETLLETFPPTEHRSCREHRRHAGARRQGELDAKACALSAREALRIS